MATQKLEGEAAISQQSFKSLRHEQLLVIIDRVYAGEQRASRVEQCRVIDFTVQEDLSARLQRVAKRIKIATWI
jgi:hypothetical protein